MGIKQFYGSLKRIYRNPHVRTLYGVARHLLWQMRKILNAFPFEQRIGNSKIIAPHRRCGVSALIYNQGKYDYNNMSFLPFVAKKMGFRFFLDIGANIGVYSLLLSEVPGMQVYAFEPHPITAQYLRRNVVLNPGRNITVLQVAVGATTGKVSFTDDPGSALNRVVEQENFEKVISVPIVRLDDVCRDYGIRPEVVKVDVEGYEYPVLQGMGNFLADMAVLCIEMKYKNEESAGKIGRLLMSAEKEGPFWVEFDGKRLMRNALGYEDPVFVDGEVLAMLQREGWRIER